MSRYATTRFHHRTFGYFLVLVLLCSPRPSVANLVQLTENRVDMVATIDELPMATDDEDVSSSVDKPVSIVGFHRNGGVTYNYSAFAAGTSRFGGSTSIRVNDSGPAERRAKVSGEWSGVYRKEANNSGQIPFRISNTKLELGAYSTAGDSAELFFAFDTIPSTVGATRDQVIDAARLEFDGNNYVTTLESQVLTGELNETGSGGRTLATYDFDVYEGSLDISSVPVDSLFSLNYRWNAIINVDATSYGAAQFYDPLSDEGGISFDTTGLTLITDPADAPVIVPTSPNAVPEPSFAALAMLAPLLCGCILSALRQRRERRERGLRSR